MEPLEPAASAAGPPAGHRSTCEFPIRFEQVHLGTLLLQGPDPGPFPGEVTTGGQALADVAAAYLLNAQRLAALQDASDKAMSQSLHDELTGLPNRTLLLSLLEHAELRKHRTGRTFAVFYLDLDGFEPVNDAHGHDAGDELLIAVARRLTTLLRPPDTVARLHGDEFAILCEDLDDPADAITRIGARLDTALSEPFALSGAVVRVTTSIGITIAGDDNTTAQQILRDADAAMYTAKRRGGNHQHLFDNSEHRNAHLERDLTGALHRGELHLEYRAVFATDSGRLRGFEALLRWQHPVHGSIPTAALISVAGRSNLIIEVGRWVLDRALTDRNHWQRHHPDEPLSIWVNTSTRQLLSAGFADTVVDALHRTATDPRHLTLEMTASSFPDTTHAATVLRALSDHGVQLALDHVGTGQSSLHHLRRFPAHVLKIDRDLIAELEHDPTARAIAAAITHVAHTLDLAVVAEGVETAAQQHLSAQFGVDLQQGFHLAAPARADHADTLIRHSTPATATA